VVMVIGERDGQGSPPASASNMNTARARSWEVGDP
jgi:hypothetical protein